MVNLFRYNSLKLEERRNSLNEKLAKKERKKEKKRRKLLKEGIKLPPELQDPQSPPIAMADTEQPINGADTQLPSEQVIDMEEQERKEEEERKKNREPPIVYKDIVDVRQFFIFITVFIVKNGHIFVGKNGIRRLSWCP